MRLIHLIFLLLTLLITYDAIAAEINITPTTCATTDNELPCKIQIAVSLSSNTEENLCLWLSGAQEPLRCYQQITNIKESLSVALVKDTIFELRDMSSRVLALAVIKVAVYQPMPKRKRRGLNWDLL